MKSSSFNEYSDNRDMWVLSGKRIKNRIKEIKIIHNGKEKALTQKGLVEKCNEVGNIPFHEQDMSLWVNGKEYIHPQYWHALCTVLDCDPEWLICELPEDCRHIQHADAHERYGLSEEAFIALQNMDFWTRSMVSSLLQNKYLLQSILDLWYSAHEDKLKTLYGIRNDHDMDPWYSGEMIKQKEYELYRSLADFIEK